MAAPRVGRVDAVFLRELVLHADRIDVVVLGSVGLVSLPLWELVLRRRVEQLVLVSRISLFARVGVLGLFGLLLRMVPGRVVRRVFALVGQLLPPVVLPARGPFLRDQRTVLDTACGPARLELHRR